MLGRTNMEVAEMKGSSSCKSFPFKIKGIQQYCSVFAKVDLEEIFLFLSFSPKFIKSALANL
jgi:hypothetical protein